MHLDQWIDGHTRTITEHEVETFNPSITGDKYWKNNNNNNTSDQSTGPGLPTQMHVCTIAGIQWSHVLNNNNNNNTFQPPTLHPTNRRFYLQVISDKKRRLSSQEMLFQVMLQKTSTLYWQCIANFLTVHIKSILYEASCSYAITQELPARCVSAFRLINGYRKLCLSQESAIANCQILEIVIYRLQLAVLCWNRKYLQTRICF